MARNMAVNTVAAADTVVVEFIYTAGLARAAFPSPDVSPTMPA